MSTTNRIDPIQMINVDRIDPHPLNPRHDLGDLGDLVKSIKAQGIRQNLLLVPNGTSDTVDEDGTIRHATRYTVVIGHRRLAAAKIAKLDQVPVSIDRTLDEAQQLELMLVENLQRTDLTPIEEGEGFQGLLNLGVTEAGISKAIGIGSKTIKSRLQLLTLPEVARIRIHEGQGSLVDAVTLEGFADDETLQVELAEFLGTVNFAVKVQAAKDRRKHERAQQPIVDALVARGAVEHVRGPGSDGIDRKYSGQAATVEEADALDVPEGSTYERSGWSDTVSVFVPMARTDEEKAGAAAAREAEEARWKADLDARDALRAEQAAAYAVRDQWVKEFTGRAKPTAKETTAILAGVASLALVSHLQYSNVGTWLGLEGMASWDRGKCSKKAQAWQAGKTPGAVLVLWLHLTIGKDVSGAHVGAYDALQACGYVPSDFELGHVYGAPVVVDEEFDEDGDFGEDDREDDPLG
ncbi:MAG TPA: ParB/RepB/Spo0J family partition protein [Propionibacteriaceae bacterium]